MSRGGAESVPVRSIARVLLPAACAAMLLGGVLAAVGGVLLAMAGATQIVLAALVVIAGLAVPLTHAAPASNDIDRESG